MEAIILNERVLSDDILYLADAGKVFKGGFVAIVEYNTFLNSWCDKKNVKRFRTIESLQAFLKKHYKDTLTEDVCFLIEDACFCHSN
jgi:hypothetical protein